MVKAGLFQRGSVGAGVTDPWMAASFISQYGHGEFRHARRAQIEFRGADQRHAARPCRLAQGRSLRCRRHLHQAERNTDQGSDGQCDSAGGTRAWDYADSTQPTWPTTASAQALFDPLWGVDDPAAGAWFPQEALQLAQDASPVLPRP